MPVMVINRTGNTRANSINAVPRSLTLTLLMSTHPNFTADSPLRLLLSDCCDIDLIMRPLLRFTPFRLPCLVLMASYLDTSTTCSLDLVRKSPVKCAFCSLACKLQLASSLAVRLVLAKYAPISRAGQISTPVSQLVSDAGKRGIDSM